MNKQATPRPWEMRPAQIGQTVDADGSRDFGIGAVIGDQNYCIAETFWRVDQLTFAPAEANARLIVRAVNSHDALVKALVNSLLGLDPYTNPPELLEQARAALALARGEPK